MILFIKARMQTVSINNRMFDLIKTIQYFFSPRSLPVLMFCYFFRFGMTLQTMIPLGTAAAGKGSPLSCY